MKEKRITTKTLLKHREDYQKDNDLCKDAIRLGVKLYGKTKELVTDRLKSNIKAVDKIEVELCKRKVTKTLTIDQAIKDCDKKTKVYCKQCKFVVRKETSPFTFAIRCNHPRFVRKFDSPYRPEVERGDCHELNTDNDCIYYKRKI